MEEPDFSPLKGYLTRVPAVDSAIGFGYYDKGLWWAMTPEEEISLNQFAQSVCPIEKLLAHFSNMPEETKRLFLSQLSGLIWQSKPVDEDIELVIEDSFLKSTFMPCVLLRTHRPKVGLPKVINLPHQELKKGCMLFLHLSKKPYLCQFKFEKGHPGKWWYADLSDQEFARMLLAGEARSQTSNVENTHPTTGQHGDSRNEDFIGMN